MPAVVAFPTLQLSDCGKVAEFPAVVALPGVQESVCGKLAETPLVVAVPALQEIVIALDIPAEIPDVVVVPTPH